MKPVSPKRFITVHPMRLLAHALLTVVLCPASRSLSQSSPSSPSSIDLDRAAALLRSGETENARHVYEAILTTDSANPAAQAGEVDCSERLALKARSSGDLDGALRFLLDAKDLVPRNAQLLYDLGILEDQMQLYRDADVTLNAAEQLDPKDSRILYALARVKMDLGQFGPAEEKMAAYLAVHPEDASAHYGLGRVYQLGVQFDKARAEFQRSIELQSAQTEAYYQLGDIAMNEGKFDVSIANFEKTLVRNPQHGGALAGLGETYFKEKKYDKALEYLKHAITAAPDYQPGHYYLGLTLARLGKSEESKQELAIAEKMAAAENRKASQRLRLNAPAGEPHANDP
jgi:tetratricopeptide (TPR) repeat protein